MKDSQQRGGILPQSYKYIKANNERFSTQVELAYGLF